MPIPLNHSGAGVITLKAPTSGTLTLTLPTADGTNGQVLSTNGSGVLSFATAGGGVTGFTSAENTTAPNATVYVDSLTASAASTNADVAFVAKGTGATLAQVPDNATTGGNKRGTYATDLQKSRSAATQVASGNYSSILGGDGNTASGTNSVVVGGLSNYATGAQAAVVGGNGGSASQNGAVVLGGANCVANANYAVSLGGNQNLANSFNSAVVSGTQGTARGIVGNFVYPASDAPIISSRGRQQLATLLLGRETTDATATILASDANSATTTNQVILPNNSAYYFRGEVIAGVTGAGNTKGWFIEGVIKRGANAASTALVGTPTVTSLYADTGAATWAITATADTTNGGLAITVTGQASTTIRWVAQIRTTEMTF
jgi:hypothetical protein